MAAFVFNLFNAGAFFDDGNDGVAEQAQGGFYFVFVVVAAAGWNKAYPWIAAIVFKESKVVFEVCGEAFAVPVCFVEQAGAVGVFVAGFVLDYYELSGPVFFHWQPLRVGSGNQYQFILLVEAEPFSGFFYQVDDNGVASHFCPFCFEDGVPEVSGADGCGDDGWKIYVAADGFEEGGTLASLGDAGDIPFQFADAVTVPPCYGCNVGLFEGGLEDGDGFADVLQHFAGVRQQACDLQEPFGEAADGYFILYDLWCYCSGHINRVSWLRVGSGLQSR